MNHTSSSYSGLLVTAGGDDLEVELELIGGRTLRMSASGDELGAWPVDDCHVETLADRQGAFRLVVDGDDAVFTPTDPIGFRALVARLTGDEPAATAVDPAPSTEAPTVAPDDPVAFLFGSAPPPVAPGPHSVDSEWSDVAEPEATGVGIDDDRLGEIDAPTEQVTHDAETEQPVADPVEDFFVTDDEDGWDRAIEVDTGPSLVDDDTRDGFAADEVVAERGVEEAFVPTDIEDEFEKFPNADERVSDDPTPPFDEGVTVPDSEAVDQAGIEEFDETAITDDTRDDSVMERIGGGSAIDKLSAAIGAMKRSASDDDEDYVLTPNTVAEEVLTSQRTLRDHRLKTANRRKWIKIGAVSGGTVAIIVLLAVLAPRAIDFLQNYESETPVPSTLAVTETTVASTTTATTTVSTVAQTTTVAVPGQGTVFDLPAPEFVSRWDAAGGSIDEVLTFESFPALGPFEERFTPYLAMVGTVQPDGTLDEFSIQVDPNGPAEYDRIGIQALGVAIATVDPDRSPEGRASLLGQLGLNVRQPQLGGIDGAVESDGIAYRLVYDEAAMLLTLTITTAG